VPCRQAPGDLAVLADRRLLRAGQRSRGVLGEVHLIDPRVVVEIQHGSLTFVEGRVDAFVLPLREAVGYLVGLRHKHFTSAAEISAVGS